MGCNDNVGTPGHQCFQKGNGTIFFRVLHSELDMGVLGVDMLEELVTVFYMFSDKGVIHKPEP